MGRNLYYTFIRDFRSDSDEYSFLPNDIDVPNILVRNITSNITLNVDIQEINKPFCNILIIDNKKI